MAKAKTTKAPKTLTAKTAASGKWGAVESAMDQIREKFGDGSVR